ncbi:hypothetical protein [Nocardia carnea]|uniref:hypothetical protein n=1 Tax=Nocardia carnea TaxID=37328 RepID=UPI002456B306|nr:hypothetical protein [Nocardia carnea]
MGVEMFLPVLRFTRVMVAVVVMLAGIAAVLVVPAPLAMSQPPPPPPAVDCRALSGQIQAHTNTIATHNASPPNPRNVPAVQAYNTRARQLNAEKDRLNGLAQQCRDQGFDVPDVGEQPAPRPQNPAPAPPAPAPAPPPAPAPAPSPAPPVAAVPAPPTPAPGGGAPGLRASPAAPAAPVVGQPLPLPVRPSTVVSNPRVTPGSAYSPAPAGLGAPAPLPGSVATNPRFTPAPAQPLQAPGLNTPAGQPGMTPTQQEFYATASPLLDALKAIPLPSNAGGGQVYRLPDLDGSGRYSNSGPALYVGAGSTRALAGPLDPLGRPTGSFGYLDAAGAASPNTGIPTINVPGAAGAYQRGHLWPNRYGGPGNVLQFLAPELGATNVGAMRVYENHLGRVATGAVPGIPAQNISYLKLPIYIDDKVVPDYYLLIAWGDAGWNLPPTYVQNF